MRKNGTLLLKKYHQWSFSRCLGSIDGKHITLQVSLVSETFSNLSLSKAWIQDSSVDFLLTY